LNRKLDWIRDFHCYFTDISAAPAARGNMHLAQAATTKVLELFDMICREHGLDYYLGAGGLLGVMRHGGRSVPWDDDIDIYMPRADYEKAMELFPKLFKGSDLHLAFCGYYMQFFGYKNFPMTFDIFPVDRYSEKLATESGKLALKAEIMRFRHVHTAKKWLACLAHGKELPAEVQAGQIDPTISQRMREKYNTARRLWETEIMKGKRPAKDGTLVCSFCRPPSVYRYILDFDWVFPTRRGKYNGIECNIPNRPDSVLSSEYGDWWALPPKFHLHSAARKLSPLMVDSANEFIATDMKKFYKGLKK
jgi:phosphorylcholine metabolism protein LicD